MAQNKNSSLYKIFCKEIIKNHQKISFYSLNPVPLYGHNYEKQGGPGSGYKLPLMLPNMFRNIPSPEVYHLPNFDVLICSARSTHHRCSTKKGVLRNFAKFTGKHLCQSLFFKRPATLLKKRLWCRFLPVNFAKFLRIPFL